jgi:hypothetical protein
VTTSERSPHPLTDAFAGAPLDVVKVIAASVMVVDHVNVLFYGHAPNVLWLVGRISFPLFAFALVCNLQRGAKVLDYVLMLLVLGAVSQPVYAAVLGASDGNILFTLAAGAAILWVLKSKSPWLQHVVLFVGTVAIFTPFIPARSGVDFGLAGMLLPAALFLVLEGKRAHVIWLVLLLVGLSWHQPDPWTHGPLKASLVAGVGSIVALAIGAVFANRPRFLPRYALHVFYPGHLLLLKAIQSWA